MRRITNVHVTLVKFRLSCVQKCKSISHSRAVCIHVLNLFQHIHSQPLYLFNVFRISHCHCQSFWPISNFILEYEGFYNFPLAIWYITELNIIIKYSHFYWKIELLFYVYIKTDQMNLSSVFRLALNKFEGCHHLLVWK